MPRPFFQGKGRQIFEKKDQNSNKKTGKLPVERKTTNEPPANRADCR
jgi:hypothetical protein